MGERQARKRASLRLSAIFRDMDREEFEELFNDVLDESLDKHLGTWNIDDNDPEQTAPNHPAIAKCSFGLDRRPTHSA